MPRSSAVIALAVCALVVSAPTSVKASFIPPIGLAPGTPYEILFVTADTTSATSSNIGDYNTFVTNEAALNPSLPSTTWNAIISTDTVNALTNAPSTAAIPVYNTQGQLITASGLYSGATLTNSPQVDQFGVASFHLVWTGSLTDGEANSGNAAGDMFPRVGVDIDTNFEWIAAGSVASNSNLSLYALSAPIGAPEPSALTMVFTGCLAISGYCFRRRAS
jgi:hypothetical protein